MRMMFLPVRKCGRPGCRAAYVGADAVCAECARRYAAGLVASKRDVAEHKRGTVRKRLGLPA